MTNRLQTRLLADEIDEGATAGNEDLMEAMVAACAAIAFADGSLDIRERRKIFTLMQTNPIFAAFSHADVAGEFNRHAQAFEEDAASAEREALLAIKALDATGAEAKLILDACREVLDADGVEAPEELAALAEIRAALTETE
jgi:tellurite resistance protein